MLGANSAIKRALGYRRFVPGRPLRALCLTSGYHLQQESCRALLALGHEAFPLNVRVGAPADVIRVLLQGMLKVKPDFLLLVNHIGFDDRGGVGDLLQWLGMPLAIWYVDNPFFVIKNLQFPAPKVSTVFLWERTILAPLQGANVEDIHYLPLATDPALFFGRASKSAYPLSFVGNSMVHAHRKWNSGLSGEALHLAKSWRRELIAKRQPMVERTLLLERAQAALPAWDILAAATFSATGHYRRQLLRSLAQRDLHLFGDVCWPKVLPQATVHPSVAYGEALAEVYRASDINVNATSLQMPTAVNQRVFDVPAAGGFLLTDSQPDLAQHFDLGREAIAFGSATELASLADFYRRHPLERQRVVANAMRRIEACHTYAHRLAYVVEHLRRRHGPSKIAPLRAAKPSAAPPC